MKNLFKTLAVSATLAALFAVNAMAQAPRYDSTYTVVFQYTNTTNLPLTGGTASNTTSVVDCRFQDKIAIQFDAQFASNTTHSVSFPLLRSGDGVSYTTYAAADYITLAFSGFTNTIITNLPTYGCGWLKFQYLTNAAQDNLTNLVIRPIIKRNAP